MLNKINQPTNKKKTTSRNPDNQNFVTGSSSDTALTT